jgi:hypothetical protein
MGNRWCYELIAGSPRGSRSSNRRVHRPHDL